MENLDERRAIIEECQVPEKKVFFLGCFASRVTVLAQQRRALNLVDAILGEGIIRLNGRVAVVGAGAAGLTAAAAFKLASPELRVELYEQCDRPMYVQAKSDRDLHPHLYDWPAEGSSEIDAGLPILNWSAQKAEHVARQITEQFDRLEKHTDGLDLFRKRPVSKVEAERGFCRLYTQGGPRDGEVFDAVVIAVGFGFEKEVEGESHPYWTRSSLTGPLPGLNKPALFISGNGDGGLVEFAMAAFNRMDQTDIIRLVVDHPGVDAIKGRLLEIEREAWEVAPGAVDIAVRYEQLTLPDALFLDILDNLRDDAHVWLHTRNSQLFSRDTAVINRFTAHLIIEVDKRFKRDLIHVRKDSKYETANEGKEITLNAERIKPLHRFLRFGANREENMEPFKWLAEAWQLADSRRTVLGASAGGFKPATPTLTLSVHARFAALSGMGAKHDAIDLRPRQAAERKPPSGSHAGSIPVPTSNARAPTPSSATSEASLLPVQQAQQKLQALGFFLSPQTLQLHIESGNANVVATLIAAGLPANTLLPCGKTPLALALEHIGVDEALARIDGERTDIVATLVRAGARDAAALAHAQIERGAPARLTALLRGGVAPASADAHGISLAAKAMRADGYERIATSQFGWTRMLVDEGPMPTGSLAIWLLLWAADTERLPIVRRLLELGTPVDATLLPGLPQEDIEPAEARFWWPGGTASHRIFSAAEQSGSRFYEERQRYSAEMLNLLLTKGASPNSVDATGRTPLSIAIGAGLHQAVELLLKQGGDVLSKESDGDTVLERAAHADPDMALAALKGRVPDDDKLRTSLLSSAVYERDLRLVEYLLEFGCDPNLPHDRAGERPIFRLGYWWRGNLSWQHQASLECLKLLIKHGAEVTSKDAFGQTMLQLLAAQPEPALDALDALLAAGARTEASDNGGRTPLMFCSTVSAATRLLSAGASAAAVDFNGYDAASHAHMWGRNELVDLLRSRGQLPDKRAQFVRAVTDGEIQAIEALLQAGVPADTCDGLGNPVLHLAIEKQSPSIVGLLLQHDANIEARDWNGLTPLGNALQAGHSSIQDYESCITLLLDRHAALTGLNKRGDAAVFCGYRWWLLPDLSRRLLDACAGARDADQNTSLMMAAQRGTLDHVRQLIRLDRANLLNAINNVKLTALHLSAGAYNPSASQQAIARFLVEEGAALEAVDAKGETPIFPAVEAGEIALVELLVARGADVVQHRNKAGDSPAAIALRKGNTALFNWLRRLAAQQSDRI